MLPVNSCAVVAACIALRILRVPPFPALELSVIVPVAVERLLMVLLNPPKSNVAPAATLTALPLLSPVVLPALSVPAFTVVAPE